MSTPCAADCPTQRYPPFPYEDGAEMLFTKALPIMLSAMVVVISWLAGRFIDKIEVSAQRGMVPRVKSGNFGTVKRCLSNEKDFHSSRGGPLSTSVQELDGLSLADEEGRLYNETYGSEHSRDDGDRYDALGDSPGAHGPSSQGPRSPSVYSHFSQSVFSQSAYGPSAYGPSQRRPSGTGTLGLPGSQVGSSGYDVSSSHAGSGASQYAGPVPSNLGASQISDGQASFNGGAGGVVYGNSHTHAPYGGRLGSSGPLGSGPLGSGPLGGSAGSSGPIGSGSIAAPPYNPNAVPVGASQAAQGGMRMGEGLGVPVGMGTSGMRGRGGGGQGGGGGAMYSATNRASPPPYAQAQESMLAPASRLPREPRPSVDSYPQENQDEGLGRRGSWATAGGDGITGNSGGVAAAPNAGGVPGPVSLDGHRSHLKVQASHVHEGPRSGFGSDSEYDGGVGTPSTFRA